MITVPLGTPPIKLGTPIGYQQFACAVATGLTVPAKAVQALITIEINPIRWRDDGVAPTAAIGMLVLNGGGWNASHFLYSGNLAAIQFIQTAAGSLVNVSYYG